MQSKSYALLLVEYLQEQATDHLDRRRSRRADAESVAAGTPISEHDLLPAGPAESGED